MYGLHIAVRLHVKQCGGTWQQVLPESGRGRHDVCEAPPDFNSTDVHLALHVLMQIRT